MLFVIEEEYPAIQHIVRDDEWTDAILLRKIIRCVVDLKSCAKQSAEGPDRAGEMITHHELHGALERAEILLNVGFPGWGVEWLCYIDLLIWM